MAEQGLGRGVSRLARAATILLCMAGAACTYTTNGSGPGTLVVRTPGTLPPVTSPPAQQPAAPPSSGTFQGIGQLNRDLASGCRAQIPIRNFVVTGNQVRYLGFRGTIQRDSFLQMQAGSGFIYGYFDGDRFVGHYWRPHPACTYDLTLDHAG
jgi:hypothetical protein